MIRFVRMIIGIALMAGAAAAAELRLERRDDRIDVSVDGRPFTAYVFAGHRKPILYPVVGPGGAAMTRAWPIVEGVPGEPQDHPHHESVWFTHGSVNGTDFWAVHPRGQGEKQRADNRIEQVEVVACAGGPEGRLETRNRWRRADGTVVCTDSRRLVFAADASARTIDYAVTIHADHGAVTFGDTKEGSFGVRVPATLQTKNQHGSTGAAGAILNSAGQRDGQAWGQRARWVGYSGPVDGKTVGLAICDHPTNPRHPTYWHARDYGLVAANPFGVHDFSGGPAGSGDYTIPAGESRTFRYLVVLHAGDTAAADIDGHWRRWADATGAKTP